MDIRGMIREDPQKALSEFGEEEVRDELYDMTYKDFADHALKAADILGMTGEAVTAARVVSNSGHYQDSKELAQRYLLDAKRKEDEQLKDRECEFLLILTGYRDRLAKFKTDRGRRNNTPILVVTFKDGPYKVKKRYGRFEGFNGRSGKFTLGHAGSYGLYHIHVSEIRDLHEIGHEDAVDKYLSMVNGS